MEEGRGKDRWKKEDGRRKKERTRDEGRFRGRGKIEDRHAFGVTRKREDEEPKDDRLRLGRPLRPEHHAVQGFAGTMDATKRMIKNRPYERKGMVFKSFKSFFISTNNRQEHILRFQIFSSGRDHSLRIYSPRIEPLQQSGWHLEFLSNISPLIELPIRIFRAESQKWLDLRRTKGFHDISRPGLHFQF
jgi:hypothetical protein